MDVKDVEKASSSVETGSLSDASNYEYGKPHLQNTKLNETIWLKVNRWLLFIPPVVAVTTVVVATCSLLANTLQDYQPFGCDPAGGVWVANTNSSRRLSIWNPKFTLYPAIPVGTTLFTSAKAIDICWDVIVGHGYGALCGIIIYNVFRTALARMMRDNPLPQEHVLAMQYAPASTLTLWTHFRGLWESKCSKRTSPVLFYISMAALIFSILYALVAPTWLSAMTSYQAKMQPVLRLEKADIPFENLIACSFNIEDGHRVGLTDNVCISPKGRRHDDLVRYINTSPVRDCYGKRKSIANSLDYPSRLGQSDIIIETPDFRHRFLPRQHCNRSSIIEIDGQTIELNQPVLHLTGMTYSYEGQNYSRSDLEGNNTFCQPSAAGEYQWGFSFLLLFPFMIVTIIFGLCVTMVHYKYYESLWHQQVDMIFGRTRAALVVASSVKERLGDGAYDMSETELRKCLSKMSWGVKQEHARSDIMAVPATHAKRGIKLVYDLPVGSKAYNDYIRYGFKQWSHFSKLGDLERYIDTNNSL